MVVIVLIIIFDLMALMSYNSEGFYVVNDVLTSMIESPKRFQRCKQSVKLFITNYYCTSKLLIKEIILTKILHSN